MDKFRIWYQLYIDVCNQKYNSCLDGLQTNIGTEKNSLEKLIDFRMNSDMSRKSEFDDKIKQKNDQIIEIEEKIEKLSSVREEMDTRLSKLNSDKVYKKLRNHPKIEKIEINNNELNVITKKLKLKGHNIGHFKFTFDPTNNRLFIRNLEYVVEGALDHWHVKNGDPCLADWKPVLWRYIDTFQIFFFIDTLIHYLLLAQGTHHAYKSFDEWIKLFETKPEIKKTENDRSSNTIVIQEDYTTTTAGWHTGTTVATTGYYYWGTGTAA